jgi:hypothetical protein
MSVFALMEEYIGHAQHRVIVHVMQALATVRSSQHMDGQLAAVAQQLKQSAPDTDEELFEVSLGALIASYAGAEMDKARSNVRVMYANTGNHEATLKLLDPTWMTPLNATVSLNRDTSAAIRYPPRAGSMLLSPDTPRAAAAVKREVNDDATQQDIDLTHDDDDATQQDIDLTHDDDDDAFNALAAQAPASVNNNVDNDAAVFSSPPACRRQCMPVCFSRDATAARGAVDAQTDVRWHPIQAQLLLLVHAHKCRQPAESGACRVVYCNTMKGVLQHMVECKDGRNCQYAHCGSSRQIIAHYSSCKNPQCPFCGPLRRNATATPASPAATPIATVAWTKPAAPLPSSNYHQQLMLHSLGLGLDGDWRAAMPQAHRVELVGKLVDALGECLTPDEQRARGGGVQDLARKIEDSVYRAAAQQDDYYHLLTEKIYKLKKARDDRWAAAASMSSGGGGAIMGGGGGGPVRHGVKIFEPAEMLHTFSAVLDKLRCFPDAQSFLYPVDYVALGIMDYPTIIKRPMDLQTMGTKLAQGAYPDPWMFCDDFRLIVDNAWTYTKKSSKIYKMATAMSEYFDREIDMPMKRLIKFG